ncbi:unnamed protein product [Rhizophagus irregularis]|uniref:Uncharacterized protein n=1 Tax=Rhizophagus irregularis TaxID=588596 RepID=A0A916EG58_9GLOM|nr:unnamed protein product [Rhizophagus irregularis]
MTLKTNMCLFCTINEPDIIEQKEFANWLLKVEDDQIPTIDRSANGLYNGTRLVCCSFQKNVIEAEIITGRHAGKHAFLPHVILSPTNATLPFTFKHCQFPIQPTFVINHRVRH